MKNRDRIIRYYQGTDNGELAARLIDLADSTAKGRPYAVSEFVSPGAVQIGETIQGLSISASPPAACPGMTATGSWGTATSWAHS